MPIEKEEERRRIIGRISLCCKLRVNNHTPQRILLLSSAMEKPMTSEIVDLSAKLTTTHSWTLNESCITSKKNGEAMRSPEIPVPNANTKHFRIDLYPMGDTPESRNYVSIFLRSVRGDFEAKCRIYLLIEGKEVNPVQSDKIHFKEGGNGWSIPKFLKYELFTKAMTPLDIIHNSERILVIGCQLTVEISDNKEPFFESELESIRIAEFDRFAKLVDNCHLSDVTLTTNKGMLHAHKVMLASKSRVFAEMFNNNLYKNEMEYVDIEDVTYDVMKEVLHFIYTGRVKNLRKNVKELLMAANKFALEDLKRVCESEIYLSQVLDYEDESE